MRLGLTEIEWGYIGAKLAQGSDSEQGDDKQGPARAQNSAKY